MFQDAAEKVFRVHAQLLELLAPKVRPAPILAIPNVPSTRVVHFGGKGRYHLPAVVFVVRTRAEDLRLDPEDWT